MLYLNLISLVDAQSGGTESNDDSGWVPCLAVIRRVILVGYFMKKRCPRCRYRGHQREWSDGRCPAVPLEGGPSTMELRVASADRGGSELSAPNLSA